MTLSAQIGQQDQASNRPSFVLNGYTKYLQNTSFAAIPDYPISLTFFHNRLNAKYYLGDSWTIATEMRNRLFFGEQLKLDSGFADQIDVQPGLLDLSIRWVDDRSVLLHTIFDRAYVDYVQGKWEVRLGRQRINWGIATTWNPNDLFNALNFLDFDYEERPGNDAIRIQYYPGVLSRVELAYAPGRTPGQTVAALLYRFNVKAYDIQTLAGYYQGELALGGGWDGSIGTAGFKGEATYFHPIDEIDGALPDSVDSWQITTGADYAFNNGLYISLGILYNSNGDRTLSNPAVGNSVFAGSSPSPKNLFPAAWTIVATGSKPINPLTTASFSVLYAPNGNLSPTLQGPLLLVLPTVTYSITENWDLDLIGQSFFAEQNETFTHFITSAFFRIKWSF